MFITVMLLLLISIWYIPARLKKLLGLRAVWPWRLALLLLTAAFPWVFMSGAYTSANPLLAGLYSVFGLFAIFQGCFFLYLIFTHISSPLLRRVSGQKIAALGLALSLFYVGYGFWQARSFKVTDYEIPIKGLAQKITIAHISDLHLGAQRGADYLAQVIEAVNARQPDIVLFNGDLVDSDIALKPELFALFKNLQGEKYFTIGNHEFYIDTAQALRLIEGAGIKILASEMVETGGIQLIGLEYMNADKNSRDPHMVNDLTIEEYLPKIRRRSDAPSILVHHSPVGLAYVEDGGIDLMLSGHTHGGQMFPGPWLADIRYPLVKGLHQMGETKFLVSQGAGTFGPWMRVGTFNEIQMVTLSPAP